MSTQARPTKPVILVVDDEALLRLLASDVFEEAGYEVIEAGSGAEALDAVAARPDIQAVSGDGGETRLHFAWKESGGPPVNQPAHRGFGSFLLGQGVMPDDHLKNELDFAIEGVACTMLISLATASASINNDTRPAMRDEA